MEIKIVSPQWGHEHLGLTVFLRQIKEAGFDGIDMALPARSSERRLLLDFLDRHGMYFVGHEYQAAGVDFAAFKSDYRHRLTDLAAVRPALINSHTGKDYFTLDQHLELIDVASEISAKTGVMIVHETHRGRMGYSPQAMRECLERRGDLAITADFSHWVCVTESMLEHFADTVEDAIGRTRYVHARVGFEEGPQVSDPRAPEWSYALNHFLGWWDRIVERFRLSGEPLLFFSTEFGPPPYLPRVPFSNQPVADQFEINCFVKDLLHTRYQEYRQTDRGNRCVRT